MIPYNYLYSLYVFHKASYSTEEKSTLKRAILFNPLDPMDHPSSMQYFPRISPNSLKISPKFRADNQIQSPTDLYIFIKTK